MIARVHSLPSRRDRRATTTRGARKPNLVSMNQRPILRTIPIPLVIGCVLFVGVLGYVVGTSLSRREIATFLLHPPRLGGLTLPGLPDTVTIDTADPDLWQYVDLDYGRSLIPPDTAGWDLALRRYQIRARGAMSATGSAPFDSAGEPETVVDSNGAVTIGKWYRYGMASHLLEPKGLVYFIRTDEQRIAKLEILSYYCPGPIPGCLTFRYAPATGPVSRSE